MIAVVIVNYRSPALALDALAAVAAERARLPALRAILVDGGSGDGSADALARGLDDPRFHGWAELLALPINGGFGWANNQAILRLLQGDDPPAFIHLLNPDTRIEPGGIAALADELARHPRCGAVGSLLIDPDGTPSGSAFRFPSIGREFLRGSGMAALGRLIRTQPVLVEIGRGGPVDWVTGASVMLRAEALKESGLFDDGFFLYFEEVELMGRIARAGWDIRHVPASRVLHVGGAATGVNLSGSARTHLPPFPPYWFASRRRLFTLTRGRAGALAASGAWLAGHALALLRRAVQPRARRMMVEHEARDLLRLGLAPRAQDRVPHVPAWTDAPGTPPAWMTAAALPRR